MLYAQSRKPSDRRCPERADDLVEKIRAT